MCHLLCQKVGVSGRERRGKGKEQERRERVEKGKEGNERDSEHTRLYVAE